MKIIQTNNLIKEIERQIELAKQDNQYDYVLTSIEVSESFLQDARIMNFKYNDIFITLNNKLKVNQISCTFKDKSICN